MSNFQETDKATEDSKLDIKEESPKQQNQSDQSDENQANNDTCDSKDSREQTSEPNKTATFGFFGK